jgi:hypothetical protein
VLAVGAGMPWRYVSGVFLHQLEDRISDKLIVRRHCSANTSHTNSQQGQ